MTDRNKDEKQHDVFKEMTPKERRKTTVLGVVSTVAVILVVILAVFAIGRGHGKDDTGPTKPVQTPAFAGSDGAIVITGGGVVDGAKYNGRNDAKTVRDYQDFLCPGCGELNRELAGPFREYLADGSMILKQYPISILDRLSDGTEYSTRTAAMAYRVAELDPKHYLDWVDVMFSKGVQPDEETFRPVDDAELQKLAVKAGLSSDDAKKSTDGRYVEYVKTQTRRALKDESLWRADETGKRQFMTPILFVGDKDALAADEDDDTGAVVSRLLGVTRVADGDGTAPAAK